MTIAFPLIAGDHAVRLETSGLSKETSLELGSPIIMALNDLK